MSWASHLAHVAEHLAACCPRFIQPIAWHWLFEFPRLYSVLISMFSSIGDLWVIGTLIGSLNHLPLHAHVLYTSAFLYLQPAASSLFERCYPISIIFKALPFSNLTRNWISMPAISQHLSPLCLLSFPACSPGCVCHSGRASFISVLADQVYEVQSCKAASVPADVPRH